MTYRTSPIKRRRATAGEMKARRERLLELARELAPATVRGVYYAATVRQLVEKTEAGYDQVQRMLVTLRRSGELPFSAITDGTRFQRKPESYSNAEAALRELAKYYRKDLWADAPCYVEVWCEKDALTGVLYPVTAAYDVPLMVARGFASVTFLNAAATYIGQLDVPAYIYHLGDDDPSGECATEKIEEGLREFAPHAKINFERLAVTQGQIRAWNLPTRPTKTSDSRAKRFGRPVSVELDAIDPRLLRAIVEDAIRRHLPDDYLAELQLAEEDERRRIEALVGRVA
jgi:hypothetical protein